MSKLLMPCPFCSGRGNKIKTGATEGEGPCQVFGVAAWVECSRYTCKARGPLAFQPTLQQARAAAREAWNNRK